MKEQGRHAAAHEGGLIDGVLLGLATFGVAACIAAMALVGWL